MGRYAGTVFRDFRTLLTVGSAAGLSDSELRR